MEGKAAQEEREAEIPQNDGNAPSPPSHLTADHLETANAPGNAETSGDDNPTPAVPAPFDPKDVPLLNEMPLPTMSAEVDEAVRSILEETVADVV